MSNFDHILLYLILFGLSFIWCKAEYSEKKRIGIIFAFAYVFIVGSRTWGADYAWYNYKVDHPNDLIVKEDEIGFQWLNDIIRIIGLNGDGAFYIYALILMIGAVSLVNGYKDKGRYMCLFVIPAIIHETSGHIRQGVAFSFALISYSFLRRGKKAWAITFAIVALNTHKIIIVLFFIMFVAFLLSKKNIPIWMIIVTYTIATFMPHVLNLDAIMQNINFIQIGGKYSGYIDNSERWFSEDANNIEWQQGTLALILSYLYDVAMFLVINKYLRKEENKEIKTLFYAVVIGAVFIRFFFLNELLRRTFSLSYMLYFMPIGYSLSYISERMKTILTKKGQQIFIACIGVIILYSTLYWGRFILANRNCNFLWS